MLAKTPNRRLLPFFRSLEADFDCFARRGTCLIHSPVKEFLFGFSFNPTSMDQRCRWLQPFGFPLYVPCNFVSLSYGCRIPQNLKGGIDAFPVYIQESIVEPDLDAERIMREIGLPMLDRFHSLEAFLDFLDRYPLPKRDSYYFLDKAATYARLGRFDGALEEAKNLRENFYGWHARYPDREVQDYELEQLANGSTIERLAQAGDRHAMQAQLNQWREENLDRFNLRDIAEP